MAQPQLKPKPEDKALFRLKCLVGYECVVRIRSSPETIITGVFDSFDVKTVPSIIVMDCGDRGFRIINFQDVSFLEEIKTRRDDLERCQ